MTKAIDSDIKIGKVQDDCSKLRYKFWKKNSKVHTNTQEKLETKKIIRDVLYLEIPS